MKGYYNEDIASEPYIARGDDASDEKICSKCMEKGCNIKELNFLMRGIFSYILAI